MDAPTPLTENPFAVLTFLMAPALLTNASNLLSLSTSNRLARTSDRARRAAAAILASTVSDATTEDLRHDFQNAVQRTILLVKALHRIYFAAGSFAAGTFIALFGAFASHLHIPHTALLTQTLTALATLAGVAGIVAGSVTLMSETRLALKSLADIDASISRWRAAHQ
jgi:hypothetical protein